MKHNYPKHIFLAGILSIEIIFFAEEKLIDFINRLSLASTSYVDRYGFDAS